MDLFPSNRGDRRFNSPFFDRDWFDNFSISHPIKTDIRETEDAYILEAEVPGFNKENINIDYADNVLTISAKEEYETDEKDTENGTYIRRERSSQSFSRQFIFQDIKPNEITAAYTDGLLTVTLPKETPGESKSRRIEIE
jgi:HSP20 family protein